MTIGFREPPRTFHSKNLDQVFLIVNAALLTFTMSEAAYLPSYGILIILLFTFFRLKNNP
jgi:hypothetical protein